MKQESTVKRARRERRANVEHLVAGLYAAGAGAVLAEHQAEWSFEHPVPWCSACPGGETFPCPVVVAAATRAGIGVR